MPEIGAGEAIRSLQQTFQSTTICMFLTQILSQHIWSSISNSLERMHAAMSFKQEDEIQYLCIQFLYTHIIVKTVVFLPPGHDLILPIVVIDITT